jgi:tyrosyl-tRNA synthetase
MNYFELLTDVPDEELLEFKEKLASQSANPMDLKKRLAREIVSQFHTDAAAKEAEAAFERVVQKKEAPGEIPKYPISFSDWQREATAKAGAAARKGSLEELEDSIVIETGPAGTPDMELLVPIAYLLTQCKLVSSTSEAKRLLTQGAIEVDDNTVVESTARIHDGSIIRVGKRRWVKIVDADKGKPA